jgi:hypothetical protein
MNITCALNRASFDVVFFYNVIFFMRAIIVIFTIKTNLLYFILSRDKNCAKMFFSHQTGFLDIIDDNIFKKIRKMLTSGYQHVLKLLINVVYH